MAKVFSELPHSLNKPLLLIFRQSRHHQDGLCHGFADSAQVGDGKLQGLRQLCHALVLAQQLSDASKLSDIPSAHRPLDWAFSCGQHNVNASRSPFLSQ